MKKLPLDHNLLDSILKGPSMSTLAFLKYLKYQYWLYPSSNNYDKVDQVLAAAKLLKLVVWLMGIWSAVCLKIALPQIIWQWMSTGIADSFLFP